MLRRVTLAAFIVSVAACASHSGEAAAPPPEPALAPNAPKDVPIATSSAGVTAMGKMLAPCVVKARAAFPDAARRFKQGLPTGESFFVVTVLHDSSGKFEQVFVAVDSIGKTLVYGRIWNQINIVKGYQLKQAYSFPDTEIIDWMISKPDGAEEGNWSGKFIDAWQATGKPPVGVC